MAKYYFYNKDSEMCYTLEYIKDKMRVDKLLEKEVYEAKREINSGHLFCKLDGVVYDSCEGCTSWKPRNGKSGCCVHWGYCYTHENKVTIKIK
ncbi:MAG: hypothetical protein GY739_09420 [Mesoflavibacter sp.]|nr:hypothetical protein [Mesoflavibacter sp.]